MTIHIPWEVFSAVGWAALGIVIGLTIAAIAAARWFGRVWPFEW